MQIIASLHQERGDGGFASGEVKERGVESPVRAPNEIGTYPIDFNPPILGYMSETGTVRYTFTH